MNRPSRLDARSLRSHGPCRTILFVGALSAALAAQKTQVSGPILSDATWTLGSSPYEVTGPIIVGGNATLTIEPGVIVELDGGKILTIGAPSLGAGTLVARGTPAQPIRFTSKTGAAGDWERILLDDEAVDATFVNGSYVAGSILEHCVVEFGGATPATGAIAVSSSSPFVRSCRFENNAATGLYAVLSNGATGPTPAMRIESSVFRKNSGGVGGGITLCYGSGHSISGSTFADNNAAAGSGIYINAPDVGARISVTDNVFTNNSGGSGGGISAVAHDLEIRACEFVGNSVVGPGGAIVVGNGTYSIADNLIVGNDALDGGAIQLAENQHRQDVYLSDNTIAGNTATRNGGGIWKSRRGNSNINSASLSRNTIADNVAGHNGGGIYCFGSWISTSGDTINNNRAGNFGGGVYDSGWPSFWGTTFAGNTAGVAGGGLYSDRLPTGLAGDPTYNLFNRFLGNSAPRGDAIFNGAPFVAGGAGDIDASFVCWGPNDPNAVPNRIWDFFDDPALGIVAATNQVVCDPISDLGAGLAGSAGVPILTASGPMVGGSTLSLALQNVAPQSSLALFVDLSATFTYLPFAGGIVVPLSSPLMVPLRSDTGGNVSLLVTSLPTGVPADVALYFQAVVVDGGAANGFLALSNAVVGITQ